MNGLLFITVLVVLRQVAVLSNPRAPMLPQANAFAAAEAAASPAASLGDRHYLDYQQWVALLEQEAAAIAARNDPRQTVLLGDSLTLWFPQELLPGRRTWINQAISGDNSDGLRQRLYILDQTNPETVFVMIGINDLIWGKPEAQLIDNTRAIVRYLRDTHPDTQIVVQSLLPHGNESATWEGRDRLLALPNERIRAVNTELRQIADDNGAYYLDLYPLFANGEGSLRADLTTDGLHLNWQGYIVWRTAIALLNETDFGK
ncbi:MAG: lysophospholipase [Cyanobacteria bacterium Co-bin13]|nr:lysophospholipase [Cyanobacteria bacterium Co-bin13]